jgi:lysophospholipid acyltransferase
MPKYPYPNKYKRLYDIIGWVLVQVNLNYIACSFILLNWSKCITAYHRMGWYTHILITASMAFFSFGGRRALRRGLPPGAIKGSGKGKTQAKDAGSGAQTAGESRGTTTALDLNKGQAASSTAPAEVRAGQEDGEQDEDERNDKDLRWVRHALEAHERQHDTGDAGTLGGEWGFVDGVMRGAETPAVEMGTPRWSRDASPAR